MIGRKMAAHRPFYRQAVCFIYLRLNALVFPEGKIGSALKDVTISFSTFFDCVNWGVFS